MKANNALLLKFILKKYPAYFGQFHCPSSGVSQHCIHAIDICHASSNVCLLADANKTGVYSVEILLMMDSGPVRNM